MNYTSSVFLPENHKSEVFQKPKCWIWETFEGHLGIFLKNSSCQSIMELGFQVSVAQPVTRLTLKSPEDDETEEDLTLGTKGH